MLTNLTYLTNALSTLYITLTTLFILDWLTRHIFIPALWRRRALQWLDTPEKKQIYIIFQQLYATLPTNTKKIANTEVKAQLKKNPALTYGEIDFVDYAKLLAVTNPQPGETFYDLGSGCGKAVFATALLYPELRVIGVELIQCMVDTSVTLTSRLSTLLQSPLFSTPQRLHALLADNIQFIHADFDHVDYSDATILFINATCYTDAMMCTIQQKCGAMMIGSRIIITTKVFTHPDFECIEKQTRLMSWGKCHCRIYTKKQ